MDILFHLIFDYDIDIDIKVNMRYKRLLKAFKKSDNYDDLGCDDFGTDHFNFFLDKCKIKLDELNKIKNEINGYKLCDLKKICGRLFLSKKGRKSELKKQILKHIEIQINIDNLINYLNEYNTTLFKEPDSNKICIAHSIVYINEYSPRLTNYLELAGPLPNNKSKKKIIEYYLQRELYILYFLADAKFIGKFKPCFKPYIDINFYSIYNFSYLYNVNNDKTKIMLDKKIVKHSYNKFEKLIKLMRKIPYINMISINCEIDKGRGSRSRFEDKREQSNTEIRTQMFKKELIEKVWHPDSPYWNFGDKPDRPLWMPHNLAGDDN